VFVFECVTAARRWQTYAGRAAFLAVLFLSLIVVWATRVADDFSAITLSRLAHVGESFYYAITGTQLALVLLAAPAYTAGAVCLDKARGTLAHVLVTDLSSSEIILGKLSARLLPVLGLILAGLPILALETLLGGIDPEALFGSFLVTVGVGVAGCSLTLALSVWGTRPHEVMLSTYAVLAIWLLVLMGWRILPSGWGTGPPPAWLEKSNPFWLAFAPYARPNSISFSDYLLFLAGCGGFAAGLTLLATLTLRRAAMAQANRRAQPRVSRFSWLRLPRLGPSLDFNPVLWREWHRNRPSRWVRLVWILYIVLSAGASVLALGMTAGINSATIGAFVNAFQFSIGLLLASILSVTSLFEERARGSLELLLSTPLPTSTIVWGKWLGTFRTAVKVTLLPAVLLCCLAVQQQWSDPARVSDWLQIGLGVTLMLAYGAAVTSLGLALATWVRRFGVAVGLSVVAYVLITGGTVLVMLAIGPGPPVRELGVVSPWFGVGEMTFEMGGQGGNEVPIGCWLGWLVFYALAALALAVATRATFDRCLGRIGRGARPGRPLPAGICSESKDR
jgi:ABC-type transport system involved in multi-copper enzyme maturation permease subunit